MASGFGGMDDGRQRQGHLSAARSGQKLGKQETGQQVDAHNSSGKARQAAVTIAIPTLTQYGKLKRLCESILRDPPVASDEVVKIFILDNGGGLLHSRDGAALSAHDNIRVVAPPYNLGVAGSWNYFAGHLGRCIIANDDVIFDRSAIVEFQEAAERHHQSIIIENDDPLFGFSTFLLNRPTQWLAMGGFDELFNPAYFEDNDARRRLALARNPAIKIKLSSWSHDQSSTLNHGNLEHKRMFWCLFKRNEQYYVQKWGGPPGSETYKQPFGSRK